MLGDGVAQLVQAVEVRLGIMGKLVGDVAISFAQGLCQQVSWISVGVCTICRVMWYVCVLTSRALVASIVSSMRGSVFGLWLCIDLVARSLDTVAHVHHLMLDVLKVLRALHLARSDTVAWEGATAQEGK